MGTHRKEPIEGESEQTNISEGLPSEEMIKILFTEATTGILISDIHGKIKIVNKAGLELLGSPSEEATKEINLLTFPPIQEVGFSDLLIKCIKERKTFINEMPYVTKWGKSIIFRFKLVPLIDKEGVLKEVLCTFDDTSSFRISEKKRDLYRGIITNSIEAITILDATGKYLEQNSAHQALIGYSNEELMGETPAIHLGEEEFLIIYEDIEKFGQSRKEVKSTTKNGIILDLDLVLFTLKDDDGKSEYLVGIIRNITDRKLADDELRKSERRLAEAQSIAHLGSWEWDILKDWVVWSDETYRIFGRILEDGPVNTEVFLKMIHPDDIELVSRTMDGVLQKGAPYKLNHRIILPDGRIRIIHEAAEVVKDENGNPIKLIGTSQDITERIQAEKAIRDSESRYRSLFEYSSIALWEEDFSKVKLFFDELHAQGVINFREYFENHPEDVERCVGLVTVLDVNTATIEMHKAQNKEALLGPLTKSFEKDGLDVFREELIALAEGHTYFRSTDVQLSVMEKQFAFIFQMTVPPRHQKSLSKVYLSIIDVTERMLAEKALRAAKDSASFYLDLLGHDITNQLQVIIGGTTLLQHHCNDQDLFGKLDDILLAGNKCAEVISKVKTTQDIMSVQLELRLLDDVLPECIKKISSQRGDVHFIYESDVEDAYVNSDEFIDILFCSILENAVIHNPKSKRNVWIKIEEGTNCFVVSISDNGIGIPDSRKESLFQRSHRFGGVGLHLAKQIVDKYGGSIRVSDRIDGELDNGAKFSIWLPKGEIME